MGLTSERLEELGFIDDIVPEPLGGAHRDFSAISESLKLALIKQLDELREMPVDDLLKRRYERLMSYGSFEETAQ